MTLRRRNWFAALAVGLVLVGAGGCGTATGVHAGSAGSTGEACDSYRDPSIPTATPSTPPILSIHLPADAVLVLATRCMFEMREVPGDGEWMFRIEQRADSGLDALATALRLPDQHGSGNGVCNLMMPPPNIITVTDTTGQMIHPLLPTGPCDEPLQEATDAIRTLPWQTNATVRVRQVRSPLEVASDCPGSYKPVVALRAAEGGPAAEPFKIDTASSPLKVCVYVPGDAGTIDVGSLTLHIGKLTKASTMEGEAARALLTAVAAAPAATATCTDEAPFATITGAGVPELEVELGGCYRALNGDSLRQLDAATVQSWHLA